MPTYVYEVISTGERFEYDQKMNENALELHPATGEAVRKLIAHTNFSKGASAPKVANKTINRSHKCCGGGCGGH